MSSKSSLTPLRKRARTVSLQVPANTSMLPSELPVKPLVYETKRLNSTAVDKLLSDCIACHLQYALHNTRHFLFNFRDEQCTPKGVHLMRLWHSEWKIMENHSTMPCLCVALGLEGFTNAPDPVLYPSSDCFMFTSKD
jgi:hypothetical protein